MKLFSIWSSISLHYRYTDMIQRDICVVVLKKSTVLLFRVILSGYFIIVKLVEPL